jgi:aminopeptidase YwaD
MFRIITATSENLMRASSLVFALALATSLIACSANPFLPPSASRIESPTASNPIPRPPAISDPASVPGPDGADASTAYEHVRVLAEEIGARPGGTPAERRAADYISGQLRSYGYEVELQEFPIDDTSAEVQVSGALTRRIEGIGFDSGQSMEARGTVVYVGLGRAADIPVAGLQGRVALIQRGEIEFQEKIRVATSAGAAGIIIFNNRPGLVQGSTASPVRVPAIIISQTDGQDLVQAVERGNVSATVSVKVETKRAVNVIGRASAGACQTVTGGHFDSVLSSPGGTDNASGTAAVLETARVMAKQGHQRNNCFIAFGAEEDGLLGSAHFVRSLAPDERRQLTAMINLDMVGSQSPWEFIGGDRMVDLAEQAAGELGISGSMGRLPPNVGSDHQSFEDAGIPVLMLFRDDNRLHTPADTAAIVDAESVADAAAISAWVLQRLN